MKPEKCIIADDFTGSADSAIHYRKAGYMPVLFINNNTASKYKECDVKVINTESRFDDEATAYKKVYDVAADCVSHGIKQIFKKIDSTMRGNIGIEIEAIIDAAGFRAALVAPSAPRNNRTVKNGICYANGMPVKNTESGDDPFNPVISSNVVKIIENRFRHQTGHIGLSVIRKGEADFLKEFYNQINNGKKVIIADAETINDLKIISSIETDSEILIAGSSGMAEALCSKQDNHNGKKISIGKKVLIVIGSLTRTSNLQGDRFAREVENLSILLDIARMKTDPAGEIERIKAKITENSNLLPVVIRTTASSDKTPIKKNLPQPEDGKVVSGFLGKLIRDLIAEYGIDMLFITGGDTAYEVVSFLETECVIFDREILPGIPLMKLIRKENMGDISIVTKAGGFGEEDAIIKILQLIGVIDNVR